MAVRKSSSTKTASRHTSRKLLAEQERQPVHEQPFVLEKQNGMRIETCFAWTEAPRKCSRASPTASPTATAGTHENGLRAGVLKAIRSYIDTHELTPRGVTLAAEDIAKASSACSASSSRTPSSRGRPRNASTTRSAVDRGIRRCGPGSEPVAEQQPHGGRDDLNRIIIAARAREASRPPAPRQPQDGNWRPDETCPATRRCSSNNPRKQLFIVEGDSAGGAPSRAATATPGHPAAPGKVLNTERRRPSPRCWRKGNRRSGDRSGLRADRMRPSKAALSSSGAAGRCRQRRPPHHHPPDEVHLSSHAAVDRSRPRLPRPPAADRVDIGKETYWAAET